MRHITLALLLFTATNAFAQAPSTRPSEANRWAAWMGCWQIAEESVDDIDRLLSGLPGEPSRAQTSRARVCVTPSPDGGAVMTTLVSGKAVLAETIVADGKSRPLADASCRGSQQAEWSQHGPRIYARTEVSCNDQPTRVVAGFSAIVSGPLWVDIQMIESEGRKSMRVRRYRRATDQTGAVPSTAQTLGTTPLGGKLSLAEVKEASSKLPPQVVQAAVLELGAGGYDLNASRLIELDEAGVHDSVIDLMVAMSFPKKFVVERAVPVSGPGAPAGFADPWTEGPFSMWSGWSYFAHPYFYSSYYSPFGYYNWGYYDPYYYGNPGIVVINPGGGATTPESSGLGRVVDGQGYTRIRPNVPDPPQRTGGNGTWGGASESGSSGGSNSGGSVSTGGYSGGGGGSDRVAVPRPPGSN